MRPVFVTNVDEVRVFPKSIWFHYGHAGRYNQDRRLALASALGFGKVALPMGFERKIFTRLIVVIAAFLPLVALSVFTIQKLINDENTIIQLNARQSLLVERLQFFNAAKTMHMPAYILSGDRVHLESFHEFHNFFNKTLAELSTLERDPQMLVMLKKLKVDSDEEYAKVAPGIKLLAQGKSLKDVERYFRDNAAPIAKQVEDMGRQLAVRAENDEKDARRDMRRSIHELIGGLVALAILAVALSAWATSLIVKLARQRRIADEQTKRISNARKEMVEVVAHDVKSPIATIQMAVELLKDGGDPKHGLDMIERSAKAVSQLISDLLDHAKIESGHLVVDVRTCDLGEIVEEVATRFQMLAQAKRIELVLDIPQGKLTLKCDPARLDQAIANLLSNAIKFTPEGGTVSVICKSKGAVAEVIVEDSGPGLTKEQIPHIFDRYWQVKRSGRMGTGLGLNIVKSIMEAHNGNVSVESEPGCGSRFHLSLPTL